MSRRVLRRGVLGERILKPTEAGEKNTLPSAEDVKLEKNHLNKHKKSYFGLSIHYGLLELSITSSRYSLT